MTWSYPVSKTQDLDIPRIKIAVSLPARNFSHSYSPAFYSLMPINKSYTKMQTRTTKLPCDGKFDVFGNRAPDVRKASFDNQI